MLERKMMLAIVVMVIAALVVGGAGGYLYSSSTYSLQIKENEALISELESKVASLQTQIKDNEAFISELESVVSTYSSQIKENEALISELESEADSLRTQTQDNQALISELEGKVASLEIELRAAEGGAVLDTLKGYGNVVIIDMVAKQFEFTPSLIVVNLGDVVALRILSTLDLEPGFEAHGISIDEYRIDELLPADKVVTIIFVADKAGTFNFYCNNYCGTEHAAMYGTLMVQS